MAFAAFAVLVLAGPEVGRGSLAAAASPRLMVGKGAVTFPATTAFDIYYAGVFIDCSAASPFKFPGSDQPTGFNTLL